MAGDASAYAALGLEPGADAAAIERAYKKLIKQYHPDREGGDPERAAEINRAYRELRSGRSAKDPLILEENEGEAGGGWVRSALAACAIVAALVLITGPIARSANSVTAAPPSPVDGVHEAPAERAAEAMDQPLARKALDSGIHDAVRIARAEDEVALASASRDCHRQLRLEPSVAQLDRCAAFDDAVVQLQDRDPLRDRGPFSELAVTGRLMSGATLLSNDYLAIDGRLDRIRLTVELALAPPAPPPAIPAPEAD